MAPSRTLALLAYVLTSNINAETLRTDLIRKLAMLVCNDFYFPLTRLSVSKS